MKTNQQIKTLEEKKRKILNKIMECADIITGSLVYLKRRCGTNKKYGAYFLSNKEKGRTYLIYIPKDKVNQMREKVERYKRLKKVIKRISDINIKIFKEGGK